jgi:2-polyprenyl-3-methyl-5-hydroxy-6-metoxy-1,4-benzoquinol methylase
MIGDLTDFAKKPDNYYENTREEMLKYVPKDTKTSLEFGCGFGGFSALLKDKYNVETWAVEINKKAVQEAAKKLDKVIHADVNQSLVEIPDRYFDCIFFNDILEHLVDPYSLLLSAKNKLKRNGVIVVSVPNVRYCRNCFDFVIKGRWDYQNGGTLDKTHLRFFTSKSLLSMFESLGYRVLVIEGIQPTQNRMFRIINIMILKILDDLMYFRFAAVAKPRGT